MKTESEDDDMKSQNSKCSKVSKISESQNMNFP